MTEGNEIKYLLLALINALYGGLLLANLAQNPSGFVFIATVGGFIALIGVIGFILWLRDLITGIRGGKETSELTKSWFQIAKGIDILLVVGLIFRAFVMVPYLVEGPSMQPNYHDHQYLLVNQLSYRIHQPNRGDVIIFHYPKDPSQDFIKRIIGLPGEKVEISNCHVRVNNQELIESYISSELCTETENGETVETITVDSNEFFVLGDNRNQSSDSRAWGLVPRKNIVGRAWLSIYPTQYFGFIKTPEINFQPVTSSLKEKLLSYERVISL